jgi:hypothetical protein
MCRHSTRNLKTPARANSQNFDVVNIGSSGIGSGEKWGMAEIGAVGSSAMPSGTLPGRQSADRKMTEQ